MKYPIIDFPRKMFTVANDNTIVCEASDMGDRHLQELHHDGDYGFVVKNDDGRLATYRLQRVVKDDDGDIRFWEFKLTNESYIQHHDWAHTFAAVYND